MPPPSAEAAADEVAERPMVKEVVGEADDAMACGGTAAPHEAVRLITCVWARTPPGATQGR